MNYVGLFYLGLYCATSVATTINISDLGNHHALMKDICKSTALPVPYER
jgi:hypothetical protein